MKREKKQREGKEWREKKEQWIEWGNKEKGRNDEKGKGSLKREKKNGEGK